MSDRYGNDILLKDGDITFTSSGDIYSALDYENKNQDLAKFSGYFNVLFSLTDRLLTIKGDNNFHADYGSDIWSFLSRPNSGKLQTGLNQVIRDAVLADARVKQVDYINITQENRTVYVTVGLTMVGTSQSTEFIFPNFITE